MKKNIFRIIALTLTLTFLLTASALASGSGPGSAADPLVSRSYVNDMYNRLLGEFTQLLNEFHAGQVMQLSDHLLDIIVYDVIRQLDIRAVGGQDGNEGAFAPVFVRAGQILVGGEGTEIILRSGSATAWIFGPDGISDVTAGLDILGNQPISRNHMLIVPRADGRGIRALTDCWFLVKGVYVINE